MIKYVMRDFDVKGQQYKVLAVHNTGMALEIGVGLTDPLKDILNVLNQAGMSLEIGAANLFYRGPGPQDGTKQQEEKENPVEIGIGKAGMGSDTGSGDTTKV